MRRLERAIHHAEQVGPDPVQVDRVLQPVRIITTPTGLIIANDGTNTLDQVNM